MAAFEVIALDTATPQLRAPGAADTYTFPRAVEMPLGTANGMLYLNGSKVVTSGSGLVFDSSGNLGLGVTPSAWVSYTALQVASIGGALSSSSSSDFEITTNAYYNGGWLSQGAGVASTRYRLLSGSHSWWTSGTSPGVAGSPISFTQAMTLDASGNLGIGSTSPVGYSGYVGITVQATNGGFINLRNGTLSHQMEIAVESGGTGYVKTVTASPLIFGTNNTENLRLKTGGQLRFVPLSSDPAGAQAGDVYYNSSTNKLRVYNGTAWVDLH